jgi:hypothetical protein
VELADNSHLIEPEDIIVWMSQVYIVDLQILVRSERLMFGHPSIADLGAELPEAAETLDKLIKYIVIRFPVLVPYR